MIYIVCWIHCLYWCRLGGEYLRSISLFEMPIIFFISGASCSFRPPKGIIRTFVNRFNRVYIPFYLYTLVWCVLMLILGNMEVFKTLHWGRILLGLSCVGGFSEMHIWFILPYMVISCSLPLQAHILKKIPAVYYLLLNFAVFMVVKTVLPSQIVLLHVLCYNLFFVIGYVSWRRWHIQKTALLICGLLLVISGLFYQGAFSVMQNFKFPPHPAFILFGLGMLSICIYLFPKLEIKYNKVLRFWNQYGYTIYLYQTVSFALYMYAINPIFDLCVAPMKIILIPPTLFLLNTLMCPLFVQYEKTVHAAFNVLSMKFRKMIGTRAGE